MPSIFLLGFVILSAVFILYWIGAFLIIYHLIRFGIGSEPKKAVVIFFIGSVILSFLTAVCLAFAAFGGGIQFEKIDRTIPEGGIFNLNEFRFYIASPPATSTPQ